MHAEKRGIESRSTALEADALPLGQEAVQKSRGPIPVSPDLGADDLFSASQWVFRSARKPHCVLVKSETVCYRTHCLRYKKTLYVLNAYVWIDVGFVLSVYTVYISVYI